MKSESAGSATGRTRNRRGEGALLRDEIVAAAERILEREGNEEALTLRSVAREAGISAPSIYTHFADRDAIIDAVLALAFERLRARVVAAAEVATDPVQRLVAGCRAYCAFGMEDPAQYRLLFGRQRTTRRQLEYPADMSQLPDVWQQNLQGFMVLVEGLRECVAAGRSTSTDPVADATTLWTSMHGAVTIRQFLPGFPLPPIERTVEDLVHRIGLITS
ncbi:TetR/AcrR family transcriptional regulator [Dactylosporangium matsuzakiense]|uniref:Transcriptional regulator, TetR family protein n=1 Tax=Dactylosporangium matsuzakiense TaxID=53360 RepID=A0A9W6NNC1_9ACTN|nr:TetR/AcrR family transcriptional regulator [Dactylosporangium matsuzakiense]UWZ42966.1 TetR/AcrR family transcriptional regulator [Dactylosporangium matsuzakiense]GLL03284.1 putative transcriptional regulator, TetR family protein [Dactylosporangium matsuzakiense]